MDPETKLAFTDTYTDVFFPEFSNKDTLAYDCMPKTINQALGFPFFTHRDQIIRLISLKEKYDGSRSQAFKARGGITMSCLDDFVITDDVSYSIKQEKLF